MGGSEVTNKFQRTTPHKCQKCGICCQGRGDLWFDEDAWEGGIEPNDCTAYDKVNKCCSVYDDRRGFCEEYPQDEWCERELKEKGLWTEYIGG
jgi:Fe-S-cluster containining protein